MSDHRTAAEILFNAATIIERNEGNPYTVHAYRKAARIALGTDIRLSRPSSPASPRLRRQLTERLSGISVDEPIAT